MLCRRHKMCSAFIWRGGGVNNSRFWKIELINRNQNVSEINNRLLAIIASSLIPVISFEYNWHLNKPIKPFPFIFVLAFSILFLPRVFPGSRLYHISELLYFTLRFSSGNKTFMYFSSPGHPFRWIYSVSRIGWFHFVRYLVSCVLTCLFVCAWSQLFGTHVRVLGCTKGVGNALVNLLVEPTFRMLYKNIIMQFNANIEWVQEARVYGVIDLIL